MLVRELATRLKWTRRELAPVAGWEPLAQPEGALIFYHPYEVRLLPTPTRLYSFAVACQRVFTDADARDPETAVKLGKAVKKAKEEAGHAEITLDPYVELALELITKKDGEWMWGYYFVDHTKRVVFWFEDHISDSLMGGVRGVERKSHASEFFFVEYFPFLLLQIIIAPPEYALESQYWFVCPLEVCAFRHLAEVNELTLHYSRFFTHDLHTTALAGNTLSYFRTDACFRSMLSWNSKNLSYSPRQVSRGLINISLQD
jgi:hypothetical protein